MDVDKKAGRQCVYTHALEASSELDVFLGDYQKPGSSKPNKPSQCRAYYESTNQSHGIALESTGCRDGGEGLAL